MTLQQLKYVIELSKHSSISAAAHALSISQPSLSTAIKELEEEFHITMLNRHHRGISFTDQGLDFLCFAHSIIEQTTSLHAHFRQDAMTDHTLHLSVSAHYDVFAASSFTSYLKTLDSSQAYAASLHEGCTEEVVHGVYEQQSQLGIVLTSPRTMAYNQAIWAKHDLEFTALATVSPYVYVHANHQLASAPILSVQDISPYPHVSFQAHHANAHIWEEPVMPILSDKEIYVTDRQAMLTVIKTTDACAIGAGPIPSDIGNDAICSIPLQTATVLTIGWIRRKDMPTSPECRQYLEWLEYYLTCMQPVSYDK